jgi:hypothetical protein
VSAFAIVNLASLLDCLKEFFLIRIGCEQPFRIVEHLQHSSSRFADWPFFYNATRAVRDHGNPVLPALPG